MDARLIDTAQDSAHRPDVSIASVASITYGDSVAVGTCCACAAPIFASYHGIEDAYGVDDADTGWHHADVAALLADDIDGGAIVAQTPSLWT